MISIIACACNLEFRTYFAFSLVCEKITPGTDQEFRRWGVFSSRFRVNATCSSRWTNIIKNRLNFSTPELLNMEGRRQTGLFHLHCSRRASRTLQWNCHRWSPHHFFLHLHVRRAQKLCQSSMGPDDGTPYAHPVFQDPNALVDGNELTGLQVFFLKSLRSSSVASLRSRSPGSHETRVSSEK